MNKLKYNILVLGFAGFGLISCTEGFLDVESKTESTTGNFYRTENDAYRALIGCYDGWRTIISGGGTPMYMAAELMSDECFAGAGKADARNYQVLDRFDQSQSPADENIYEQTWKDCYAAIYRCNMLLSKEGEIQWLSEENRKLYMGECRAIRAICYFDMVRLWGNIPLFTEPVNENLPQSDPKAVYNVIFTDLQYAVDNIPADAYPKSEADKNDGHITKAAAQALLARVYLYYTGIYGEEPEGLTKANVLAGLEDIISNAEANGYGLVENFKDLWPAASTVFLSDSYGTDPEKTTYAGDGNKETILAQKFNYTQDYNGNNDGNRWLVNLGIRGVNSSPYGKGWGICTVNPEFVKNWEEGDTRKSASVIDIEGEGIDEVTDFTKSCLNEQREYTGYYIKKYTPMAFYDGTSASKPDGSGDFMISQHQDYVIMRYADVLLMAAELGSPNAKDYLNQVRKRAYTNEEGEVSSHYKELEATKENIMKERMLEFAFEGLRYWDLLRQGIDVAANTIAVSNYGVLTGGSSDQVTIEAENVKRTNGLSQIPNNQITLSNGTLKQNPGW